MFQSTNFKINSSKLPRPSCIIEKWPQVKSIVVRAVVLSVVGGSKGGQFVTIHGIASEEELHFDSNLCDERVKGQFRYITLFLKKALLNLLAHTYFASTVLMLSNILVIVHFLTIIFFNCLCNREMWYVCTHTHNQTHIESLIFTLPVGISKIACFNYFQNYGTWHCAVYLSSGVLVLPHVD